MAGALEDFSRRPLQYKVMVFAGIGALLGLLYWQFMLSPLRKERDAAAADLEGQKSEAKRLKAQKKAYDDLVAKEAQLKEDVEQNQKALPTEAEIPAFLDMLSRKTSEAGVELLKRDVRKDVIIEPVTDLPAPNPAAAGGAAGGPPPVAPSAFVKVPVDVEVVGTYYQLKKFFSSLRPRRADAQAPPTPGQTEEKDRIVTIESLTLTDPKVKNNEIVLTARFVASTFRAKAQDPVPGPPPPPPPAAAPPAGGTPPAGAAPATGAAGGTAVPGTAAKPDSMKAKTENAMDQSDVRTRKAAESDGEALPRENPSAPPRGVP